MSTKAVKNTQQGITFGSFNNIAKLTDEVLSLWTELMGEHESSSLVLKNRMFADEFIKNRLKTFFEERGINSDRLKLIEHTKSMTDHLRLYDDIDIALDPFPYNGTTTSCEALWMGVPVVTLAKDSHRSRVSASILNQLGYQDWVAYSAKEYKSIISKLINDQTLRQELRQSLRTTMVNSNLCNSTNFAQQFESALLQIIQ